MEIVGLRNKIEKSKDHVEFNESSVILDEILKCQRISSDKSGLGFKKEEDKLKEVFWSPRTLEAKSSKTIHAHAHDNKDVGCSRTHQGARANPQSKESIPRWKQGPRYEFNRYCFSCSNVGYKEMDCVDERKNIIRQRNSVRCWTCNQEGHIAATCHTLRCYMCSGFEHKSQECASQRSQPRRSSSYKSF